MGKKYSKAEPSNDHSEVPSFQRELADAIEVCARQFAKKMLADAGKNEVLTVAEMIRLLPLLKDLRVDEPVKEIEVRWIDAPRPESSN